MFSLFKQYYPRLRICSSAHLSKLLLLTISLQCAATQAAVLFEDDFDRNNNSLVGNNWSELEKDSNDVAIYQDALRLRDYQSDVPDAAAIQTIEVAGFENLSLQFDWRATSSTEASDMLFVGWQLPDENFSSFWQTSLGGSDYETVSLAVTDPGSDDGLASLAFWIDVGSANETVYIDNILFSGAPVANDTDPATEQDDIASVSEPSSTLLLALGLSFLYSVRRKNRSQPGEQYSL